MSWEEMSTHERPCPCGKGVYVTIVESDDWNRDRSSTEIRCPACAKESNKARKQIAKHNDLERKLREKAEHAATAQYAKKFVSEFAGLSKKAIWQRLFAEKDYPSLNTFYTHIQYEGLDEYLKHHFLKEIDTFIPAHFADAKIELLLKQAAVHKSASQSLAQEYFMYLPRDT